MGTGDAGPGRASSATRSYAIAFHDVWEAALASAAALRGWEVLDTDSRAGEIRLQTLNRLGRAPSEGRLRLWLDDLGQTRLEVHFEAPRRLLGAGAVSARATRFLNRLERSLGLPRGG